MRRIMWFFAGIMMLGLMCAAMFFAAAVYDTAGKTTVDVYFFQPDNLSQRRVGTVRPLNELSDSFLLQQLIQKFVVEYFYVIPDLQNVAMRTSAKGPLYSMTSPRGTAVFKEWVETAAVEIADLAERGVMRTVRADQMYKPADSNYWHVVFELHTWDTPNDMGAAPVVSRGVMYLEPVFEATIRQNDFDVKKYLRDELDPAGIFRFNVVGVEYQMGE